MVRCGNSWVALSRIYHFDLLGSCPLLPIRKYSYFPCRVSRTFCSKIQSFSKGSSSSIFKSSIDGRRVSSSGSSSSRDGSKSLRFSALMTEYICMYGGNSS
ncbi:unnamed protein product [Prunus brigantina]